MNSYNEKPEQRNDLAADDYLSVTDRYARRLSRKLGLPLPNVRTAVVANAAVKEH